MALDRRDSAAVKVDIGRLQVEPSAPLAPRAANLHHGIDLRRGVIGQAASCEVVLNIRSQR
ncbi:MAG: hypothetical protein R3B70_28790 [Polyangiaceae bacterium]